MTATPVEVASLHRYFIWADLIRINLEEVLMKGGVVPELHEANGMRAFGYLAYWHAGLHVVIEGWTKLRLSDAKIDVLVASPNVDLLRTLPERRFPLSA
jgi:hypothetical protein